MDFLKRFWAFFLSLGAVVGFYFTLLPDRFTWVFWGVVGLALALAALTKVAPKILTWGQRIRDYPALLQTAGQSRDDNQTLRAEMRAAEAGRKSAWAAGVEEGRRQVIGAVLAQEAPVSPQVVAITPGTIGSPTIIARWPHEIASLGARFRVEARASGMLRGIVEVMAIDSENNLVELRCVERSSQAFWDHLEARAPVSEEPPNDIALNPTSVSFDLEPRVLGLDGPEDSTLMEGSNGDN